MKVLKPSWICDSNRPVFSIAVHPDGSRFAIGGQGKDSGSVSVWNMAPVRSEVDEADPDVPKLLCEMTNHLACVNCVRWSRPEGKWLASGGDDCIVMIWQYKGVGKPSFGSGTDRGEQWGLMHMLRSHNGDVLDLAWSQDSKLLASASVDNTIIVWNALNLPEKTAVIQGHQGMVKGVTWDPVGKYIASQSDDSTVRVWRVSDWKEEKAVHEPFKSCGGTTVLRLNWSPDGKYLVSAHALNNDGPIAKIIERSDWNADMDFVGHRKAVEVVSFNPHLFIRSGQDNYGCVALGSRDRSVSVWLTNLKRPLVVMHDLFSDSVLDLSWSCDGYELMLCSVDGSVGYMAFSEKELGSTMSESAIDELFKDTYGLKRTCSSALNSSIDVMIEDPDVLKVKMNSEPKKSENVEKPITFGSAKMPTVCVAKQQESRTKDGKRRITPVMLTVQPNSPSSMPLPFTSSSALRAAAETAKSTPESKDIKSPAKTITFAPLYSQVTSPGKEDQAVGDSGASILPKSDPGKKRPLDSGFPDVKKKVKKSKTVDLDAPTSSRSGGTPLRHSVSQKYSLPVPPVETTHTVQVASGEMSLYLDVNNAKESTGKLTCQQEAKTLWVKVLPAHILIASGNKFICCAALSDRTLCVYSTQTGRLLSARLNLPAKPYALKLQAYHVMVVTCDAQVMVWNFFSMTNVFPRVSFSSLLDDKANLRSSLVTKEGLPVLVFEKTAFAYNKEMEAWMELYNQAELSEIQISASDTLPAALYPLEDIQKHCEGSGEIPFLPAKNNALNSTLTYVESQISRSLCLQSSLEYHRWVMTYVRCLVKENMEEQLREFCLQFTGPLDSQRAVLGYRKQVLLKEMLKIVLENGKLQRLYRELSDSLEN